MSAIAEAAVSASPVERFIRRRRNLFHGVVYAVALWLATPSQATFLAALIVVLVGLSIRVWALTFLHKDAVLTVAGPYAMVRHPLYVGNALMTVALCLAANNFLATVLVIVVLASVYWITLRLEERRLFALFGDDYLEYRRRVPAFVPRLCWRPECWTIGPTGRNPVRILLHYSITIAFLLLFVVKDDFLAWYARM